MKGMFVFFTVPSQKSSLDIYYLNSFYSVMLTVVPCPPCLASHGVLASHSHVSLSLQSMRSSGTTCPASLSTVTRSFISGKERKGGKKTSNLTFCSSVLGRQQQKQSWADSKVCLVFNRMPLHPAHVFKDREFYDPVWATKPAKPNLLVEDQMLIYVSFSAVCKWLSLSGLFLCLLHLYMQYL